MNVTRSVSILTAAASAALIARPADAGVALTQLPTLGGTDSIAFGINDNGQVVGQANIAGDAFAHAYLWSGGVMTDLHSFSADYNSAANAINNHGEVVGWSDSANPRTAMLWNGQGATDLGADMNALGPSVAWDINDRGVVVGQAPINPGFAKGFVWDPITGGTQVGSIPGYNGGANRAINADGVVAGHSFFFGDPDVANVAVPNSHGGYDAFEVGPQGFAFSIATDINNNNLVVGHTNFGSGPWHATIFLPPSPPDGGHVRGGHPDPWIDLGTLPNLEFSEANAVNDDGVVVGFAWDDENSLDPRAWVYMNNQMIDLNDLLPAAGSDFVHLLQATDINSNGDIVGFGRTSDGALAGFVLQGFVPSPGSFFMLAMSAAPLLRRRR